MTPADAAPPPAGAPRRWVLALRCPDRPGIVHAVTGAVAEAGGNIEELQQFSSLDTDRFFMRVEVSTPLPRTGVEALLVPVAERFGAEYELEDAERRLRTLVLGSKAEHAVNDLLFRQRSGHLNIEVPLVMANHARLGELAAFYGVPFEHRPIAGSADRAAFEERVLEVVERERIELVVLARYMQILSPELCERLAGRIINIHHSFLPGFKGASPYRQAHARGVKLIGATAHFVTVDLDEGPIIEQNVHRVDHARTPEALMAIGQDVESKTLTQAVKWYSEHRVFLDGSRTVVFG
ncbi:MAG: formyltetrahydrofolate deformylase [Pseudoclavibacter sp.]|nr:formyltetrahydrofolate deformylase [Pseudoclavibacter sp.]